MKCCDKHWQMIRTALDERGLTPFVAKSGEEAAARMQRAADEGETKDTFEPLIGINIMLMDNALRFWGITAVQGDGCPVCMAMESAKNCTCGKSHDPESIEKHWTIGPADCALERAKQLGLVLDIA